MKKALARKQAKQTVTKMEKMNRKTFDDKSPQADFVDDNTCAVTYGWITTTQNNGLVSENLCEWGNR